MQTNARYRIQGIKYMVYHATIAYRRKIAWIFTLRNKIELKPFRVLTNFHSKYIFSYSYIIPPFAKKNLEFNWTFQKILSFKTLEKTERRKTEIRIFDPKIEIILITDRERNFANIEKRALALIWSTERSIVNSMG